MNYYGIDFGDKNCGIAKANEIINIASPYKTVDKKDLILFFEEELKKDDIIIFGLPKSMSFNYSKQSFKTIDKSIEIKKKFSNKLFLVDERLTTKSLYNEMKGKVNSKKIKKTKDQNSAVLILSVYLNNPNIGYELKEKEIYTVDKSKLTNVKVLVQNIAIKNPKEDISYEIKDPWLFWYYFNRNIISEYNVKNKDIYDVIISSENIKNFIK